MARHDAVQIEQEQTKSWAQKYHALESKCHSEQGVILALWREDALKHGRSVEDEWKAAGISKPTASRKIRYAQEGFTSETYWEFLNRIEPSKRGTKKEEDSSNEKDEHEDTDEDESSRDQSASEGPLEIDICFNHFVEAVREYSAKQYLLETQGKLVKASNRQRFSRALISARTWIDEVLAGIEQLNHGDNK